MDKSQDQARRRRGASAQRAAGSTEFYRHIMDGLTSGVIVLDTDAVIITANRAACRHLDLDGEALQPGTRLDSIPHGERFVDVMRHMIAGGEPIVRHEIAFTRSDGAKREIGLSASLLNGKADATSVIFLFTDMTERRRLERVAELNRQLAAIGELTAGVVHELRSPLSVLGGTAELLLRKLAGDDPRRSLVESINREAAKLEKLIAQFLGFAKPFELDRVPCRPEQVVERALELCKPRAYRKNVRISAFYGQDLPQIEADADKASQALANVVNNAIDAVPEKEGEVAVRALRDGESVVFEVTDNGPGIQLNPGEDLFTPFLTKKRDGTGLGLAIVHRIVAAHQGSVSYGNRIEGGAEFDLRFPIQGSAQPTLTWHPEFTEPNRTGHPPKGA